MKRHMFAPAAVACLKDGRAPRADEIEQVAAKIWQDAFRTMRNIEWAEVEPGSRLHSSVNAAALVSLGAVASFGPDMMTAAF